MCPSVFVESGRFNFVASESCRVTRATSCRSFVPFNQRISELRIPSVDKEFVEAIDLELDPLISSLVRAVHKMALIRRSLPISSCSSLHTFKSTKNLSIGNWTKRSYYVLPMFPYPSGALHLGHIRVYALSDAHCRYRKLLCSRDDPTGKLGNKKVLHPMGWDAFGLPAENAAKERGIRPSDWTRANIAQMKRSLQRMGFDFDWKDSELCTSDPSYYKWTQWLFLRLYKAGLVYQDRALVNWDPSEGTVLAKGEVDSEGRALRSRTIVEKRWMTQWFIRMTAFAEVPFSCTSSD